MARRLNAMLLQMQMMPKARMATKDQLTRIFVLEAEAMREEIDALDHAAKHSGMFRDPSQHEADRQVGWAYPLFDAYCAKDELSFEEGVEAREALIDAGAEADDIPFIAATYGPNDRGLLSDREGSTRSPFLRDVLHRMAQVGLDDTVLRFQKIKPPPEETRPLHEIPIFTGRQSAEKPKLPGGLTEEGTGSEGLAKLA
ncbi:MAG: hypothetical protein ACTHKQ_08280 [Mesorhizobium sp.]